MKKKRKYDDVELRIKSKEELECVLKKRGIDTSDWRTRRGVKTVDHLWREILECECVLMLRKKDGKICLVRRVSKVYLNVFYRHHGRLLYLREVRQVFRDGGRRCRTAASRPSVGEKMKPGEGVSRAFARAMEEELGISKGYAVASRKKVSVKKKLSKSYPGLRSELTTYAFHVELSSKQYRKRYVEVQSDKKTFFEWRPVLRCACFMRQYRKARNAFKRRRCVRKTDMLSKNGIRSLKRYIVR